jgi:hypothetical protein
MFDWTDTQELECDAPPYPIVEACESIGIRSPLDVRWCRVTRCPQSNSSSNFFGRWMRRLFNGKQLPSNPTCFCRKPVPETDCYRFTSNGLETVSYRLGQCNHCWAIFWEEV